MEHDKTADRRLYLAANVAHFLTLRAFSFTSDEGKAAILSIQSCSRATLTDDHAAAAKAERGQAQFSSSETEGAVMGCCACDRSNSQISSVCSQIQKEKKKKKLL